jgi:hypothetical protein
MRVQDLLLPGTYTFAIIRDSFSRASRRVDHIKSIR